MQHFQNYLREKPGDLEVRWLLNLAYMTLGKYPDVCTEGRSDPAVSVRIGGRHRPIRRRGRHKRAFNVLPRPAA